MKPKLEAGGGGLKCAGLDCRSPDCWHVHTQGTLTVELLLALEQKARPPARGPESDRTGGAAAATPESAHQGRPRT